MSSVQHMPTPVSTAAGPVKGAHIAWLKGEVQKGDAVKGDRQKSKGEQGEAQEVKGEGGTLLLSRARHVAALEPAVEGSREVACCSPDEGPDVLVSVKLSVELNACARLISRTAADSAETPVDAAWQAAAAAGQAVAMTASAACCLAALSAWWHVSAGSCWGGTAEELVRAARPCCWEDAAWPGPCSGAMSTTMMVMSSRLPLAWAMRISASAATLRRGNASQRECSPSFTGSCVGATEAL
jgi:hypothetical protein